MALKNVLTLGIHTKVWLYRINREMDGHEGFHIDLRWLAVLVTLPIITPIVVKFQTARRMNQMVSHQVTVPLIRANRLGWISIIPILGSGFFAWWVQSTLNKHWFHHRREERVQLAKDRIVTIDQEAEPAPALVEKRQHLAEEVARMEREIAEEIEAARIRWGEERFEDRMKRAKLHEERGGRMSRKELAKLREDEKRHRKEAKRQKKGERGRLFGLLPARTSAEGAPAGRDPDNDADWLPTTPPPPRTPDEIQTAAAAEGRELNEEETKELKTAEKLVAKREKEAAKLEAQREKLRVRLEKERAKAEAAAEKQRLKEEAAAEKERLKKEKEAEKAAAKGEAKAAKKKDKPAKKEKKVKPAKGEKKRKKGKKGKDKETGDEKIPVDVKPRTLRAPPTVHEAGEGPLRLLTVKCPRCRTEIQDIKKRGDAPAKITCPTCHLVGKI